jgi:hypothetical protein
MRFYKIFSALVLLTLFTSSAVSAGSSKNKIYVPREAIEISDEGMCLIIGDDEIIPIHALYSDDNGLYVCDMQFIAKYGYCRRCQNVHAGGECPPDRR